jgi:hypothetical protein
VPKFTKPAIRERRPIDAHTIVVFLNDCPRRAHHSCHSRQRHANRQTVNLRRSRGRGRPLGRECRVDTSLTRPRLMFQPGNRAELSIAEANASLDNTFTIHPARFPAWSHERLNLLVRHPRSDAVGMPTTLGRPVQGDEDSLGVGLDKLTGRTGNEQRADECQSADFLPSTEFRHSKRLMKPPPSTRLPLAAS